jgi:hypothetical protein
MASIERAAFPLHPRFDDCVVDLDDEMPEPADLRLWSK